MSVHRERRNCFPNCGWGGGAGTAVSIVCGLNSIKGFGNFTALRKYNSLSYLVNISLWSRYKSWHFLEFSFIKRGYLRNYIFKFGICFSCYITFALSLNSWLPKYHWLLSASSLRVRHFQIGFCLSTSDFKRQHSLGISYLSLPSRESQKDIELFIKFQQFQSLLFISPVLQELVPKFVASLISLCSLFAFPVLHCLLNNSAYGILSVKVTGVDFSHDNTDWPRTQQ